MSEIQFCTNRIIAGLLMILGCISIAMANLAIQEGDVTIDIEASVPGSTSADAKVYIAGNLPAVGGWRADGLAMEKQGDGRWRAKLQLPKGQELQYKFTLGSWAGVEKGKNGEEIANRVLKIDSDQRVETAVQGWQRDAKQREHTLTGNIKHHRAFASEHLTTPRDLIIYLPPGYDEPANEGARYPVMYMHDGQNLFDAATSFGGVEWRVDETMEKLIQQGSIIPAIIVGICNTPYRTTEYTYGASPNPKGKSGEDYLLFVVDELKPHIDKTYRTRPDRNNTAIGGSSLGGLISLYMASSRPDVFSKAAVISPSLFWDNARAIKEVPGHAPYPKEMKFWVDIGTKEGRVAADAKVSAPVLHCRELIAEFEKAGLVKELNYRYDEVEGAAHNEEHWSKRVDQVLLYFFGK